MQSNYEKLRDYCIEKGVITIDCTCLCGHEELDHRSHHGIFRGECEHGDGCKEFRVDASKPEMQIGDVLRALGAIYFLRGNGELMVEAVHSMIPELRSYPGFHILAKFNLALPLSHPDNDEACGKVLALINMHLITNNKDND